jgi:hypothetical protein
MVNVGSPTPMCTSTWTDAPWEPMTLAERIVESMRTSRSGRMSGMTSCVRLGTTTGEDASNDVTGFPMDDLRE